MNDDVEIVKGEEEGIGREIEGKLEKDGDQVVVKEIKREGDEEVEEEIRKDGGKEIGIE